ncbi:gluconokinase [Jannaschia faecimaris]|uniref:gluconokinase n=1 Tax=Jannaschia faecimaris TaxID=1244108 RepID=A0A1H3RR35_9RHOB|nr:hypothetical protein [Jannaschia faecimaris]SDZ27718.1 gluconokinase [Jannaschia faecimaris]
MNIVVMGVAWTGRSSIGAALANSMDGRFIPGCDLHPPANRAKLARREVLTQADYDAWFDAIGFKLAMRGSGTVVACPALRREQRDRIRFAVLGHVTFVYLYGPRELIEARMIASGGSPDEGQRQIDHQLSILEEPTPDEGVISIDMGLPQRQAIDEILAGFPRQKESLSRSPHPGAIDQSMQVGHGA